VVTIIESFVERLDRGPTDPLIGPLFGTDEEGNPLGLVPWHAVVLAVAARRPRSRRRIQHPFIQEFGLTASSRREALELLERRLERNGHALESLEELFRIDVSSLPTHVQPPPEALARPGIWYVSDKTEAEEHPGGE
jgi:hypothetical protein